MSKLQETLKKRLNKKSGGFTLVEIIVVLVILAILAAAIIPTMLGYVQESKGKTYVTSARTVKVAAQSVITENLAVGVDLSTIVDGLNSQSASNEYYAKLKTLCGDDVLGTTGSPRLEIKTTDSTTGAITDMLYSYTTGSTTYYVTIKGETATVSTTKPQ